VTRVFFFFFFFCCCCCHCIARAVLQDTVDSAAQKVGLSSGPTTGTAHETQTDIGGKVSFLVASV